VVAVLIALLAAPTVSRATSCTTQAEMNSQDRETLASAGQQLSNAVLRQDFASLQSTLLPAVAQQWDGIRAVIEQNAPSIKGGQAQVNALYLLDASSLTAPADTQFFCSNSNGSLTVTVSMHSLPAGKYAVILANVFGAPGAGPASAATTGQLGFILGLDGNAWKLGGVFIRPGTLDGHDGVWFWQRARELARSNAPWSAWFCYETARFLLLPVDFISSPNLEKLGQEQAQLKGSPAEAFPYALADGARTWKIDSIHLDSSLRQADLAVTYESTGVSDPAAVRTEATAVMSALLKAQPSLRQEFHGLWAYSSRDGKVSPVMELPMAQIP
jgi:type II secretory pathway pseudopilin PulG